jgi:hypothetical protein
MTDINATLNITVITDGLTMVQPTSPAQYYTPATGQRAFTLADAIGSLSDQIGETTDPTSTTDSPDVLYNFVVSSDGMILVDSILASSNDDLSIWDDEFTYAQGAWQ